MAVPAEAMKGNGRPTSEVEVTLRRDLGLLEVLMIGLGPNIGSTIFVLVGIAIGIAGPAILLVFILNFVVTLFTAMAYAELASAFPETGGGYLWIQEGLPSPFGFLGGWMSWIGHCVACAVYSLGFGLGVAALFSQYGISIFGLSGDLVAKLFSAAIAAIFIYLNYRGVKGAGRSEVIVSVFLIGIIVIYVLFCVLAIISGQGASSSAAFEPFFMPAAFLSVATSMAFTFMIFEGYEVVAQTGEEAKEPERTVPRAMFLCIAISCVLFFVIALVTLWVLGWQNIAAMGPTADQALVVASSKVVPLIGGALISVGIIIGSIAAVNSVVFSSSRVSFAMGRDGNLPAVFGRLHRKNQTPSMALFISGTIIILASVLLPLNQVASVADILILLLFTLVNVAALTLRHKRPDVKRHFITPLFPFIPLAGIGTKIFLAITLFTYEPIAWYLALAVIYAGLLLHYFARGRKEIERMAAPLRAPLTTEELRRYRVLIPIDDPRASALIDLGTIIAKEHNGELLLTSVVEVPTAVPIDAVDRKLVEDKKRMLEKLKRQGEMRGVPTRALVSVSHEVVTALIETAREEEANMMVMGWKGYSHSRRRVLGQKADQIVRLAPCDVILLRAEDRLKPDNILILSGGLWHVSKATEVAAHIAKVSASRVTILDAIINEKHIENARKYAKRLADIVESHGVPVITKEIHPETIVGGVVAETLDYDLLVVGASAAGGWEKFAFGPIQDKIIRNAKCPVLVYKRSSGRIQSDTQQLEEEEKEEREEMKEEEEVERATGLKV